MAVSVNTDLIMGVLNAAQPASIAAADAKLNAKSMSKIEIAAAGDDFAKELLNSQSQPALAKDLSDLRSAFSKPSETDAHKKFEAMVLHQFVQHMLPSDTSVIFGEGMSGDVWKGMMAQQIGDAIAKGGGIGIAEQMLADNSPSNANPLGTAANIINARQRDLLDSLNDN
ncbi:MAG: rod-binding protein [Rhizobiaceae bacterium]|nr:rod-binding protein [Rhizobiaceae bacterium]